MVKTDSKNLAHNAAMVAFVLVFGLCFWLHAKRFRNCPFGLGVDNKTIGSTRRIQMIPSVKF